MYTSLHVENNDAKDRRRAKWKIICVVKSNVTHLHNKHLWLAVTLYTSTSWQLNARRLCEGIFGWEKEHTRGHVCVSHVVTLYRFVNDDFMWFSWDAGWFYSQCFSCFICLVCAAVVITQCDEVACALIVSTLSIKYKHRHTYTCRAPDQLWLLVHIY